MVPTPVVYAGKFLDTHNFDDISSKLNLTDAQRKSVERAKSDIADSLTKLQTAQHAAEYKYTACDGDCSREYTALNKCTQDLKSFSPIQEFERRLAEILQPSQLQTYQTEAKDKNTSGQAKKI